MSSFNQHKEGGRGGAAHSGRADVREEGKRSLAPRVRPPCLSAPLSPPRESRGWIREEQSAATCPPQPPPAAPHSLGAAAECRLLVPPRTHCRGSSSSAGSSRSARFARESVVMAAIAPPSDLPSSCRRPEREPVRESGTAIHKAKRHYQGCVYNAAHMQAIGVGKACRPLKSTLSRIESISTESVPACAEAHNHHAWRDE